jgi:hypothetical protein
MIRCVFPALLLFTLGCAADEARPRREAPAGVVCRKATGPITIDGLIDEPAWKAADPITDFRAHWQNRPARSRTTARLLWDEQGILFAATMDDIDLYADVTERNGTTWNNDVFELFFKPSTERRDYYEFQINALNTPFETYLPSRGAGGFHRFAPLQKPLGLTSAVKLRGTLNNYSDRDEGWSVEGRIPWSAFTASGGQPKPGDRWTFALCRYDYSIAYDEPDLSSTARLTQPNFHRFEDYGELQFEAPTD